FIEFEGKRYSCPGDYAMVESDGTLTLLGRGSVVINTAGEKVFPEEVEEVIKTYPGVRDAVVVGVPDDKFGEAVTAGVEAGTAGRGAAPAAAGRAGALIAPGRANLASYRAPRHVVVIDTIGRAANGKVDYKRLKAFAIDTQGGA